MGRQRITTTRSPEELAELQPLWAELERIRSEKLRHAAGSESRYEWLRREREVKDKCYALAVKYRPPIHDAGNPVSKA